MEERMDWTREREQRSYWTPMEEATARLGGGAYIAIDLESYRSDERA